MAVIAVVPLPTAVASPGVVGQRPEAEQTVAICSLLELQAAWLVTLIVAPEAVVPMAVNWLVSGGAATVWAFGIMASEMTSFPPAVPPPPPATVKAAVADATVLSEFV